MPIADGDCPYGGRMPRAVRIRCRMQPGLSLSLRRSRPVEGLVTGWTEHLGVEGWMPASSPCRSDAWWLPIILVWWRRRRQSSSGLGAGKGLLYDIFPMSPRKGGAGHEGAFLLCSFWLVDNLAKQGRLQEAMDLLGFVAGANRSGERGFLGELPPSVSAISW
jgi:hypothetical protein